MTQLPLEQKIAALRRFSRFFAQRLGGLEAGPAGSSYSATEVRVLTELAQYEQRTVTALSRSLGLDAGYLSRVIRRLETTGIVVKSSDSADSRQQPMSLTAAGREEVTALETISTARYASLVRTLPSHIHGPLLDAMERIEGAFGVDVPARDQTPWLLRPHRAGDVSQVVHHAIASAAEEFGPTVVDESTLLTAAADFLQHFDAARDCSWMAERDGAVVGAVLLRHVDDATSRIVLLHVESRARGIGIGRRLIAEAVGFATRAGRERIEIRLSNAMKSARYLLHAAGFRHAGAEQTGASGDDAGVTIWLRSLGD